MSPDHERDVPCNLCGARDLRELKEFPEYGSTFVECRACGLMFYSPRLREGFVVSTYLRACRAEAEADSMIDKGVFFGEPAGSAEEQINALKAYYRVLLSEQIALFERTNRRRPRSIFEAGTSVGWHLATAKEMLGITHGELAAGCDANVFAADRARTRLGLSVCGDRLSQYPAKSGSFDLIAAYDYIEHTYTPADDLRTLHALAAPGSILALKTFLHELDEPGAYVHPIFHAHHFTAGTLSRAIEQAGWQIEMFDDRRERVYAQVLVHARKPE